MSFNTRYGIMKVNVPSSGPLILPYKGKTNVDMAAFYCPYVPLQHTGLRIRFRINVDSPKNS